jgi:hypothetical protein
MTEPITVPPTWRHASQYVITHYSGICMQSRRIQDANTRPGHFPGGAQQRGVRHVPPCSVVDRPEPPYYDTGIYPFLAGTQVAVQQRPGKIRCRRDSRSDCKNPDGSLRIFRGFGLSSAFLCAAFGDYIAGQNLLKDADSQAGLSVDMPRRLRASRRARWNSGSFDIF